MPPKPKTSIVRFYRVSLLVRAGTRTSSENRPTVYYPNRRVANAIC